MGLADGRPWGVGRVSWAPCVLGVRPHVARCLLPAGVIAIALFKKGDVCRGQQPAHRCLSAPDARLGFAYLRLLAYFSAHPNAQYPAPSRAHLPLSTCLCAAVCIGPSVRLRVARRAPPSFTELGSFSVCSRCPEADVGCVPPRESAAGCGQSQRPPFVHFPLHAKWRSGGR